MGTALFYHLTRSDLETVLSLLLARALQSGWHVVVRGRDMARLARLDEALWLGPEEGFLPHGLAGGAHDADQPVLLTTGQAMPNDAKCLMSIDGADVAPGECTGLERVWILFDGTDDAAVQAARTQWKALAAAGAPAQYWSEASGRWQMKAESPAR